LINVAQWSAGSAPCRHMALFILCSKLLAPTVNPSPTWRVVTEDCLEP
jgi:hypothetical protein